MSKVFGRRLYKQRKMLRLTQQQVADVLNVHRTTYTYYESGKSEPSIDTLYQLTVILNITADELIKPE